MAVSDSLAHQVVVAPGANPVGYLMFLHGILGSGANWRSFAKQLVAENPNWGAVLVDLRMHGESHHGFEPPHTIDSAARDVLHVIHTQITGPVHALLGHSFGGKVALEVAQRCQHELKHLFVIDSTPSVRPDARGSESTRHIVELLQNLPPEFADRAAFSEWIEARGVSRPVAMWLAMNVRPLPNTTRFVFRVDVTAIRAMLEDYFKRDLWFWLEHPDSGGCINRPSKWVHFIVGGKSSVVDESDRARAAILPNATLDVLPQADHWVHGDAPDALRALVGQYLNQ